EYFKEKELIEILQGLISKDSENPSSTEESTARYIQDILYENGINSNFTWVQEGRPNVFAEINGVSSGKTLLYNGHLDVVPAGEGWKNNPFLGNIIDGKMYGRGSADMKSGVAAMIYAAIVIKRMGCPFQGKIVLFFNIDEERENLGMWSFL